ncbi:MAG: hypothetical protein JWN15_1190 [Firmicutes bacterium]|nr:hypothetical protein [Bacillota bacterium]
MNDPSPSERQAHSAARRYPRQEAVASCPACGEPAGRNYRQCPDCTDAVDRIWYADWHASLTTEQIAAGSQDEQLFAQVVFAEYDRHPWTVVDIAMTLIRCSQCGCELGGGPRDCPSCVIAFGSPMQSEWTAGQLGLVTRNEHALHIGRWVLRYPHRQTDKTLSGWRFSLPILLAGAEPPSAKVVQVMQPLILAGREDEAARMWEQERLRGKGLQLPWFRSQTP